ncbi:MAG: tripartite tricarboxylate transporter substrate-binding protein, partial [candidate division NC10 bacterium]
GGGSPAHIAAESFNIAAGVKMQHVPYKGGAPAITDLIGGQVDFIRGAARSKGGKPIIALPSTALDGNMSRIKPHLTDGAGVVTTRGDVHYVVTEYGIAYLHGKTVRERTMALIEIAHEAETDPEVVKSAPHNAPVRRLDEATALAEMQRATRNYAKRQVTWFRREPAAEWVTVTGDEWAEPLAKAVLDRLEGSEGPGSARGQAGRPAGRGGEP